MMKRKLKCCVTLLSLTSVSCLAACNQNEKEMPISDYTLSAKIQSNLGENLHFGRGKPTPKIGEEGDFYIESSTFVIYRKGETGAWEEFGTLTGPEGKIGPVGEKGDRGERGERGPQGDRGEQGIKGDTGSKGDRGERGEKGERGERGDQGAKGEQGQRGEKGEKGERGEKGEKGERGPKGVHPVSGRYKDNGDLVLTFSDGSEITIEVGEHRYYVTYLYHDKEIKKVKVPKKVRLRHLDPKTLPIKVDEWYLDKDLKNPWRDETDIVTRDTKLYAKYDLSSCTSSVRFIHNNRWHLYDLTDWEGNKEFTYGYRYSLLHPRDYKERPISKKDFGWQIVKIDGQPIQNGKILPQEGVWSFDKDITLDLIVNRDLSAIARPME